MISWMKKRKPSATSASQVQAEDNHAASSQTDSSVGTHLQNDCPSPDLEHLDQEQMAEVLGVDPDATASAEELIRRSAEKHFPSLPPDGAGVFTPEQLKEHLNNVRRTVHDQLQQIHRRHRQCKNVSGLVEAYHRRSMNHVHALLEMMSSSQLAFVVMEWLCHTYLSQQFLGDPDFSVHKQRSLVDMHLYSETMACVNQTLRSKLQSEVENSLEKIAQQQESEFWRSRDLHTDVIQCMNEPMVRAEAVSESMKEWTREVCFLQLQEFLNRFNTAKQELQKKYKETPKMVVQTCILTLITCHGLVSYIQTCTDDGTRGVTTDETLSLLRTMETDTLDSMEEHLVKIIKDFLKTHFKSRKDVLQLTEMEEMFRAWDCCPDVQKRVLDVAYEQVSASYLDYLASSKKKDLEKRWGADLGPKVTQDAQQLHQTFLGLHPGVSQQNLVLLKVEELLRSKDVDSVKLTLSEMMQLCQNERAKKLLSRLLRWKDLSECQVQEVLEAVQDLPTSKKTFCSCIFT